MKKGAFFGNAVEGWGLDYCVVRVDRGMRPAPVVGDTEKDVRPLGGVASDREKKEDEKFHVGIDTLRVPERYPCVAFSKSLRAKFAARREMMVP